jgi:hypothetical protein
MEFLPITDIELEQYRFHPAWKAALQFVKQKIDVLPDAPDLDTYQPFSSGSASGRNDCIEIIEDELAKVEGT